MDDVDRAFVNADRGIWAIIGLAAVGAGAILGTIGYALGRLLGFWG